MGALKHAALAAALALALASALSAAPAAAGPTLPSPWKAGIAFAAEGFGPLAGHAAAAEAGEITRCGIVFDILPWPFLRPSLEAFVAAPVFPWSPAAFQVGAILDLRLFEARSALLERISREPLLYAPSVAASLRFRPEDYAAFAGFGLRLFETRTGDGVYAFLSPWLHFSVGAGGALEPAGYGIELVSFTHFYL